MQRKETGFQDSLVSNAEDFILKWNGPSISGLRSSLLSSKSGRLNGPKECVWLKNFFKICLERIGKINLKALLEEINHFTDIVAKHVALSYSSPKRAAKIKGTLLLVLHYFHYQYSELNLMLDDESDYLEKMSHLLTMYLDMEVKASRRGRESVKKITSKLISSLLLFLRSSTDHIMNTILNSELLMKCYNEIWIPIFKCVTTLPITENMTYVRCLLLFKLWKRFSVKAEEKSTLNEVASARLSTVPEYVLDNMQRGLFIKVLPLLPANTEPNKVTKFYMMTKFNIQDSIKGLYKWVNENKDEETLPLEEQPLTLFDEPTTNDNLVLFDDFEDDHLDQLFSRLNTSNLEQDQKLKSSLVQSSINQSSLNLSKPDLCLKPETAQINLAKSTSRDQNLGFKSKTPELNSSKSKSTVEIIDLTAETSVHESSSEEEEIVRPSKKKTKKQKMSEKEKDQGSDSIDSWDLRKMLSAITLQQSIRQNTTPKVSIVINNDCGLEQPFPVKLSAVEEVPTVKETTSVAASTPLDVNIKVKVEIDSEMPIADLDSSLELTAVETMDEENVYEPANSSSADNSEENNLGSTLECTTNLVGLQVGQNTGDNSLYLETVGRVEEITSVSNEPTSKSTTDCNENNTLERTNQHTDSTLQMELSVTELKTPESLIPQDIEPYETKLSVQPESDSVKVSAKNNKEKHIHKKHIKSAKSKTAIASNAEVLTVSDRKEENEPMSDNSYGIDMKLSTNDICNQPQQLNTTANLSNRRLDSNINEHIDNKSTEIQHDIVANKPIHTLTDVCDMDVSPSVERNETIEANDQSTILNVAGDFCQTKVTVSAEVSELENRSTKCSPTIPGSIKVKTMNIGNVPTANPCNLKTSAITSGNGVDNRYTEANIRQIKFDEKAKERHATKDCNKSSESNPNKISTPKELKNASLMDQVNANIRSGKIRIAHVNKEQLIKNAYQSKSNKDQQTKINKENTHTIVDSKHLATNNSSEANNEELKHKKGTKVKIAENKKQNLTLGKPMETELKSSVKQIHTVGESRKTELKTAVNTDKNLTPIQNVKESRKTELKSSVSTKQNLNQIRTVEESMKTEKKTAVNTEKNLPQIQTVRKPTETKLKTAVNTEKNLTHIQTMRKPTETELKPVVNTEKSLTPIRTVRKPTETELKTAVNTEKNLTQIQTVQKPTETQLKTVANTKKNMTAIQTVQKPTETQLKTVVNTKKNMTLTQTVQKPTETELKKQNVMPVQSLGTSTVVNISALSNKNWTFIKDITQVETSSKQTKPVVKESSRDNVSVKVFKTSSQHKGISQQSVTPSMKSLLEENKGVSTNDEKIINTGVLNVVECETPPHYGDKLLLPQDITTSSIAVNATNGSILTQNPTVSSEIKPECSASDCRFASSCSKATNTNTNHSIENLLYSEAANIVNTFENFDVGQEITIKQETPFEDHPSSLLEDLSDKRCLSRLSLPENADEVAKTNQRIGPAHKQELETCLLHDTFEEGSSQDEYDCIHGKTKTHRVENQVSTSQLQPQEIRLEQWEKTSNVTSKPLQDENPQPGLIKVRDFSKDYQINTMELPSGFEITSKDSQESCSLAEDYGSENSDSNLVIDEEADCAKDPNAQLYLGETYPSNPKENQDLGERSMTFSMENRNPDITRDLGTHSSFISGHNPTPCVSRSNTSNIVKREHLLEECMQRNLSVPTVDRLPPSPRNPGSGLILLQEAAQLEQESSFQIAKKNTNTSQVTVENHGLPFKKIKLTHLNNLTTANSPNHWQPQVICKQNLERFSNMTPIKPLDSPNMKINGPLITGQAQYLDMQQNCLLSPNVMRSPPAHCNNTSPSVSLPYQHRNMNSPHSQLSTSPHFDKPINVLSNAYQSFDQTTQSNAMIKQQFYERSQVNSFTSSMRSPTAVNSECGYSKQNIATNIAYARSNASIGSNMHRSDYLPGSMNSRSDPLCLVVGKSKEESREQFYEIEGFTVAQEVEVYSAPEVVTGDWIYSGTSEISDPDWPIGEQSVVDTSSIATREQYLYTPTPTVASTPTSHCEDSDVYFVNDSIELYEVVIDFQNPEHFEENYNEKVDLHMRTMHVDYELCKNQNQFKNYFMTQDLPTTIPAPFPTKGGTDLPVRCSCMQCHQNRQLLLKNYQMLTNFFNSRVKFNNPKTPEKVLKVTENPIKATEIPTKPLENPPKAAERPVYERDHSCDNDCSLPLKKRKTMTLTNLTSTEPPKMTSYPNTPMISIAALEQHSNFEPRKQVIVTNPQSPWKPPAPSFPVTRQASLRLAQNLSTKPQEVKTNKRKPSRRRKSNRHWQTEVDSPSLNAVINVMEIHCTSLDMFSVGSYVEVKEEPMDVECWVAGN